MSGRRPPIVEWPRWVVAWLCSGRQDYQAFQRRKASRHYRAKRRRCLWLWLGAATLLLACPGGACVVTVLLVATLLSFAVLE